MDSLRPLRKAAFTDVLDYGVFFFRKHFRKILLLNLMFNLPVMLLIAILNPMLTSQYWGFINPSADIVADPAGIVSSLFTLYAMIFVTLGLYGLHSLTLANMMEGSIIKIIYADAVLKQEKTLKQVIRECFGQFGSMLLGKLLYGLIMAAVLFAVYIIIAIGAFAGTFAFMGLTAVSISTPWVSVVLTILCVLVLVALLLFILILMCFFIGRYRMFLPAICIEQQKAGSSIGRCGNLGKNSFFLISLAYAGGGLLVGLFPGVINISLAIASAISGNLDVTLIQMGTVVTQVFSSVLQPLLTCILSALYITLRVKREGLDIEMALWEIKKEEFDRTQRWVAEAPNVTE